MAYTSVGKSVGKKGSPSLERKEERLHKDLDGDKERGESPAHKAKVLGKVPPGKGSGSWSSQNKKPAVKKKAPPNFAKAPDGKMPPFLKKK